MGNSVPERCNIDLVQARSRFFRMECVEFAGMVLLYRLCTQAFKGDSCLTGKVFCRN